MKEKITKEILIKKNSELETDNKAWSATDEIRRKEFAKAFSWYEKNVYNYERSPKIPTWSEIFVELGKLLATRDFRNLEGKLSEIDMRLLELEKEKPEILN